MTQLSREITASLLKPGAAEEKLESPISAAERAVIEESIALALAALTAPNGRNAASSVEGTGTLFFLLLSSSLPLVALLLLGCTPNP